MRNLRFILGITILALLGSLVAFAQTGSIIGTVTDKSGAVIQGASVTVTSLDTKATHVVTTTGTGAYTLTNLPVGRYEITVKKDGFRTLKVSDAVLAVDQVLSANAQLEPGAVSEEVQVQGSELPPVDLDTAQVSNLVSSRQMQDLPLITRDPYSLVLLSPGTAQTNSRLGGFTVNGSRERNNNFLLDGVDNNDTSVPGIPDGLLSANPDSTEEFRVITNNFNAEYGRNTGAIIDVVTKGGTNAFHGAAYEFGRWNGFGGARDWFNPRTGSDGTFNPMNPYVRNQFGYSFGGPIFKNKTFFFVNEEFQRYRTTLTNSATVPTAAFKTGIFTWNGQPVDLTASGANNAFGAPLDPTVQKLLALYPTPPSSTNGLTGTVFFPSSSRTNGYNPVVKIDHQITKSESVSLRYAYNHSFDPNPFHDDSLPGNINGVSSKAIVQGASANLTSTLKPTLINNFVFGWNRLYDNFSCGGTKIIDSVGPVDRFGNGTDYLFDAPFTNFGCTNLVADNQWRKTGTTSYGDNITWVRGNHTLKFGADFRNIAEQGPDNFFSRREFTLGTFITQTGFSLINPPSNDTCLVDFNDCSLDNAAAMLYGFVGNDFAAEFFNKTAVRQATDNKHFRQHEYDWFGQDTWKVRRNLTLTLGLRYQLDGVPFEENANFSNLLANPGSFANGQDVVMSIVGPGTGNMLYKQDYSNIEPRVGLSWDPFGDGKTAVRSAFGIFHDRVFGNLFGNARGNPPFEQDYNHFPFETVNNAFGGAIGGELVPANVPDNTPSPVIHDDSQLAPVLFDTHFRNLASNNWNFGIQRELPGNNVIDLAYIGSEGHHIYRNMDGNPPDPALVNQLVAYCSDPNNASGCVPSEVSGILLYEGGQGINDFGILPFNAVNNNALVQPFYQRSVANSIYNSLQAKITHRISHGLQLQGSYTWAHGIDDAADPLDPAAGNRTFPRNSRNLSQDRGNSDNDVRHVAVINYIWELPIGHGRSFLSNGVIGKVFEGMQLSGITTAETGHPFEVRSTHDSQRTGISAWANLTGQDPFAAPADPSCAPDPTLGRAYFKNTFSFVPGVACAFAQPVIGSGPGSIGRNQFYGPHFVDFDLEFAKKAKITERVGLELKVQAYNIFNHPLFTNPGADGASLGNLINSGLFGVITSTITRPDGTTSARQLQTALKLTF